MSTSRTAGRTISGKRSSHFVLEPLEPRRLLSATHLYTFNDGTGADAIGRIDLQPINGVTFANGKALLDNTGISSGDDANVQYLNLPTAALPGSGPLTVEVWFTTPNAPNWTRVLDFGDQSGTLGNTYLYYTPQSSYGDSRLTLRPASGSDRVAEAATTDDGLQHMLAAVVDPANDLLSLYVDGASVATEPLSGTGLHDVNLALAYFGRSLYDHDPGFTGSFDEVRIYDEARLASAIADAYAQGPTDPYPDSPVRYARQAEKLDRGLVAVRPSPGSVYVGWRMLGDDPADVAFNLYRSTNGREPVRLNATPLTQTTDYYDTNVNLAADNTYFVRAVVNGQEQADSESYTLPANAPIEQHLTVPLSIPTAGVTPTGENYTYSANDATVGDLDGDGDYEIILKWDPSNSKDNSQSGYTGNVYIDAYTFEGAQLWRIDLGRNIRAGAHYTQMLVYDFDGDGKSELVLKTAPGTVDGQGNHVLMPGDDPNADYRNASGYVLSGPEYLTIFDGLTGAELQTIDFPLERGSVSSWGDGYGNRVDRFLAAMAYLDGERPSIVWARGYYGPSSGYQARNEVVALDWRDGQLTQRWRFNAATNGDNPEYIAQGSNALLVGDVDGDGRDEIIHGAAALDDDGTGLYSTGLGHGDALHMSDMDPANPGLEVFMVHESPGAYESNGRDAGGELRDAQTGALLFQVPSNNDVGRGVAADIDPNAPGYEFWATTNEGTRMIYNVSGQALYATPSNMMYNFGIWWDADLSRELLDGTTISEWNNPGRTNLVSTGNGGINNTSGLLANNGTKNTPSLTADILGDWREEVIWRRSDNTALEIWTTTIASATRLTTLMHDTQYRSAVAGQNVAYNQPPNPSYWIGQGMPAQTQPLIYYPGPLEGDLNGDGFVGISDLNQVLGIWNSLVPDGHPVDINGDNFIGITDLNAVLGNWNAGTPPAVGGQTQAPPSSSMTQVNAAQLQNVSPAESASTDGVEVLAAASCDPEPKRADRRLHQLSRAQGSDSTGSQPETRHAFVLTGLVNAWFSQPAAGRQMHGYTPRALEQSENMSVLGLWEEAPDALSRAATR